MNERKLFNIQQFLILFASRDCVWISPFHAHFTSIANIGVPVFHLLPLVPCTKSSLLGRKKCRGCCKQWLEAVLSYPEKTAWTRLKASSVCTGNCRHTPDCIAGTPGAFICTTPWKLTEKNCRGHIHGCDCHHYWAFQSVDFSLTRRNLQVTQQRFHRKGIL